MKNIKLTWEQAARKGAYLAEIYPWYAYANGQRTEQLLGFQYILVNRDGYDKFSVKVAETKALLTQEEIDASQDDIPVVAEGFVGTLYNRDGRIALSGKADKVVLA